MSDGGDLDPEVPAASPPADAASDAVPTSETPPVPEIPVHESASPEELTASPIEEREVQAAPAQPEPPELAIEVPEEIASSEPILRPEHTTAPPAPTSEAAISQAPAREPAVSSAATPATSAILPISARLGEALEALRFRKKARLEKILQLAAKKGRIRNDDVEKLLRVSDSTAQRYLNQLVIQAKLRRVGHAKQPHYEPL